jgi:hypothetical protein
MRASSTVGKNALGGALSWVSQSVKVSLRSRPGWRAAKIWATAPPVSFATKPISASPAVSQKPPRNPARAPSEKS